MDAFKVKRQLREVQSVGGMVSFMDKVCEAGVVIDDEENFRQNAESLVSYIDEMVVEIDKLSAMMVKK